MEYLLDDLTVIDAATFLAGPGAATILGDGSVALILDVADMHRLGQSKKENPVFGAPTRARPVEEVEPS